MGINLIYNKNSWIKIKIKYNNNISSNKEYKIIIKTYYQINSFNKYRDNINNLTWINQQMIFVKLKINNKVKILLLQNNMNK